MHTSKLSILMFCMVFVIALPLYSGQTGAFIGVSGDYRYADDPLLETHAGRVDLHGNVDHRMLLGDTGFLAVSLFGEAAYAVEDADFSDYLEASLRNSWLLGPNTLEFSLGARQSFGGYDGSEPFFIPSWAAEFRFDRGFRSLNPFVTYEGYVDDSGIYNGVRAGFVHMPAVEFRYGLSVGGTVEVVENADRPDLLGSVMGSVDGLSGYFLNWSVQADATYRDSTDAAAEGFSGNLLGTVRIAPSRSFQIQVTPSLHWTYLIAGNTWDVGMETALRSDFTATDHLFWYVETVGTMDRLESGSPHPWSVRVSSGVDLVW